MKKGKDIIKVRVSLKGNVFNPIFFFHAVLVKNPKASLTYDIKPILTLKFSFQSRCVGRADGQSKLRPGDNRGVSCLHICYVLLSVTSF